MFAWIVSAHDRLVGWRVFVMNTFFAIFDVLIVFDWSPIVSNTQTLGKIGLAQAIANALMRIWTRGPIGVNPGPRSSRDPNFDDPSIGDPNGRQ